MERGSTTKLRGGSLLQDMGYSQAYETLEALEQHGSKDDSYFPSVKISPIKCFVPQEATTFIARGSDGSPHFLLTRMRGEVRGLVRATPSEAVQVRELDASSRTLAVTFIPVGDGFDRTEENEALVTWLAGFLGSRYIRDQINEQA